MPQLTKLELAAAIATLGAYAALMGETESLSKEQRIDMLNKSKDCAHWLSDHLQEFKKNGCPAEVLLSAMTKLMAEFKEESLVH